MQELIRTRCKQGKLVITDEFIRVELPGGIQQRTLYRSSLTGIDSKIAVVPSIIGHAVYSLSVIWPIYRHSKRITMIVQYDHIGMTL